MNFDCSLNIHFNVNSAHVLLILLCPPQPSCLVNHGKSTKTLLSQNTHMRHGFNYGAATWCTAPHPCISLSQHNRYTHHMATSPLTVLQPTTGPILFTRNFGGIPYWIQLPQRQHTENSKEEPSGGKTASTGRG